MDDIEQTAARLRKSRRSSRPLVTSQTHPGPANMTPQGWENHRAELASVPARSLCPVCKGTGWLIRNERVLQAITTASDALIRCPTCGSILMVFVQAHGMTCVDLNGLTSLS